jgi:hypothetical protein
MDQVVAQALTLCKQMAAAPDFTVNTVKAAAATAAVGLSVPVRPALGV